MAEPTSIASVRTHWYQLIDGLQASPKDFYSSVESEIRKRQVPVGRISRVDWREGGILSALREYLRVEKGRYVFDICGVPYANGFYVSWWLAEAKSPWGPLALFMLIIFSFGIVAVSFQIFGFFLGLLFILFGLPIIFWLSVQFLNKTREGWDDALVAMPLLGPLYERIFRPETYFRIDSALMFQEAVHRCVNDVIDQLTSAKGIRALSELERKPILREFAGR